MYFYYVQRLGRIWPRLSATHPKDRLQPEKALQIVELKSPVDTFCLNSLVAIYPFTPKGPTDDQR
jgi:hypothetical protein